MVKIDSLQVGAPLSVGNVDDVVVSLIKDSVQKILLMWMLKNLANASDQATLLQ